MRWYSPLTLTLSPKGGEGTRRGEGLLFAFLFSLFSLSACDRTPPPAPAASTAPRAAPSIKALGELEYTLSAFDGATVRLSGGRYDAPADQPDADKLIASAELHPLSAIGDLDGDGSPDAAVVVFANGGGSGTFFELIAVLNTAQGLTPLPGVALGDRIALKRLEVRGGVIQVEMLTAGPNDPLCCPTLRTVRAWQVKERALVETALAGPAV